MRYARTSLLSIGAVIAYCLIAAVLKRETEEDDVLWIILLTVFVFLSCIATDPDTKSRS